MSHFRRSSRWQAAAGVARVAQFCTALAVLPLASGFVPAQPTFTRIVQTGDALPGGGTYPNGTLFPGSPVAVSGANVSFGIGGASIYRGDGSGLTRIVNSGTVVAAGTVSSVSAQTQSGVTAAFVASGSFANSLGVYAGSGGALTPVADTSTAMPGTTGVTFSRFHSPSITGTTVAFFGDDGGLFQNPTRLGVYTRPLAGGSLTVVADSATAAPGGGTFADFGDVRADGDRVAFLGTSSTRSGVYRSDGGTLTTVADTTTPIPGGAGTFVAFRSLSLSGDRAAFIRTGGVSPDGLGVYAGAGGAVALIADTSITRPDGGTFTSFKKAEVGGGVVAFLEGPGLGDGTGLYLRSADGTGPIIKLLAAGDTFDGKVIASMNDFSMAADGSDLAFTALFTNNTVGVYVTPVPEPAGLLAVAGLALVALRRTKRPADPGRVSSGGGS